LKDDLKKNGRQPKKYGRRPTKNGRRPKKYDDLKQKWKMNQSTKIKLIGCDTIVNSPSFLLLMISSMGVFVHLFKKLKFF
jgi:hypothetical protein